MPTLDEAIVSMGNAKRATDEPQSIKDDLVQRLYGVDTTLIILNERLGYLADRIMGQDPESDMVAEKSQGVGLISPAMIHELSDSITTLERQAAKIEQTINRFNGLV
jgi:hypothetical protein